MSLGRVDGVQITLGLIVVIKECNCCLWVSVHCGTLILFLCSAVVVVLVAVVHSRGSSAECEGTRTGTSGYAPGRAPSVSQAGGLIGNERHKVGKSVRRDIAERVKR